MKCFQCNRYKLLTFHTSLSIVMLEYLHIKIHTTFFYFLGFLLYSTVRKFYWFFWKCVDRLYYPQIPLWGLRRCFKMRKGLDVMRMTTNLWDQGALKSPWGFLPLLQPLVHCCGAFAYPPAPLESICAPVSGSVFFQTSECWHTEVRQQDVMTWVLK